MFNHTLPDGIHHGNKFYNKDAILRLADDGKSDFNKALVIKALEYKLDRKSVV